MGLGHSCRPKIFRPLQAKVGHRQVVFSANAGHGQVVFSANAGHGQVVFCTDFRPKPGRARSCFAQLSGQSRAWPGRVLQTFPAQAGHGEVRKFNSLQGGMLAKTRLRGAFLRALLGQQGQVVLSRPKRPGTLSQQGASTACKVKPQQQQNLHRQAKRRKMVGDRQ